MNKSYRLQYVLIILVLIILTCVVYWQITKFDFAGFDDQLYITENTHLKQGITPESISWAFVVHRDYDWHPLTWLAHMFFYQLFGLNPGMHHLINLFFHIANTLLLFFIIKTMTGLMWQSAFVAALFALHPLNVESVVWISELKNVLSSFFWMLTIWCYLRYTRRTEIKRYLLTILVFATGLLAKAMLVTLPLVLILLDFWPLKRFHNVKYADLSPDNPTYSFFALFIEKIPFFALSAITSYLTFLSAGGSVLSIKSTPLKIRAANALVSYVSYIKKMVYPTNLAVFYPYPSSIPFREVAGAFFLLTCVFVFAFYMAERKPYFTVGWLWYTITLIPVIGLVQGGLWPAMADRFTYLPFIGLFIIVSWGIPDIVKNWKYKKIFLSISAILLISVFSVYTWFQTGYWKNSITLFEHTVSVTENNFVAHNNLGTALYNDGKYDLAVAHFKEALRIEPCYVIALYNFGNAMLDSKKYDRAVSIFSRLLNLNPEHAGAYDKLGIAYYNKGNINKAGLCFKKSVELDPKIADAYYNLGKILYEKKEFKDAAFYFVKTIKNDHFYVKAYNYIGVILVRQGTIKKAKVFFTKALQIDPEYTEAQHNLDVLRNSLSSK